MRLPYLVIMVIVCTFINAARLSGQSNINITAGFGFPDLVNAGIRYQIGQAQIGVAAGFMPVEGESVTSASLDLFYHVAGSSELSTRRPWYGRLGLAYFHDKKAGVFNEKFVFLDMRGGREFNISQNFGISLDAGVMYRLFKDVGEDNVSIFLAELFWAFPSAGIGLFYRF